MKRRHTLGWLVAAVVTMGLLGTGCTGDEPPVAQRGGGGDAQDDRERFNTEADGVRAAVADCFVRESSTDGRRYRTTVEVDNRSDREQAIRVTIVGDPGTGGTSDSFIVAAGAGDAWGVSSEGETKLPVGDVDCPSYITAVEIELGP